MSGRRPRILITAIALLTSLLALSCPARAVPDTARHNDISMRISPTYITTEVRDGDFIGPITVSNTGTLPLDIQGFIKEGGHDENGIPIFSGAGSQTFSKGIFLTLEPAEFRLMQGESKSIKVRAHVAPGFSGGAYPVILFRGRLTERKNETALHASSQVGVLTLITVESDRKEEQLETASSVTAIAVSQDPSDDSIVVSAICENQGDIHTDFSGTATMKYCDGQLGSQIQLAPVVCLPGCKRIVTGRFKPSKISKGIYIAEVLVTAKGKILPSIPVALEVADTGMVSTVHMDLTHPQDSQPQTQADYIVPKISAFTVANKSIEERLPIEVCLQNPYETSVRSIGYVEILDSRHKRVGLMAFNGGTMPPGGTKIVRIAFIEPLLPGYYTAQVTLQMGNKRRHAQAAFVVAGSELGHEG